MHQHKIDPYFGALFITVIGAGATLMIVHTINTTPPESLNDLTIQAAISATN